MVRIQFDGYYYEGEVNEKGEPHGYGIEYYDSGTIFKGHYSNGKENGPGITYYTNGKRLEVGYINGDANGPCRWYLNDELTQEGEYLDDKMSGYWVINERGLHMEGTYVNDHECGRWIVEGLDDGHVGEYEYVDGKMNGPSIYTTSDGYCSAGEYRDDLEIGHWVDYFSDGAYEDGYYVNGLMEGYWTMHHPDGSITKARFRKGIPKGRIIVITDDGDEISVGFKGKLMNFRGRSADGKKFDMTMDDDGNGSAYIEDNDGTKVSGAYHDGKEYGRWSVSDKDGFAEMDLTGGNVNSSEYKEKKRGFFSRLFGKKKQ